MTPPTPGNDLHWTQVQIFLFDFDLKVIIERKTNAGARSYARKARKAKTARNARNLRNVAQGQRDPYKQGIYYPYFFVVIFPGACEVLLTPQNHTVINWNTECHNMNMNMNSISLVQSQTN